MPAKLTPTMPSPSIKKEILKRSTEGDTVTVRKDGSTKTTSTRIKETLGMWAKTTTTLITDTSGKTRRFERTRYYSHLGKFITEEKQRYSKGSDLVDEGFDKLNRNVFGEREHTRRDAQEVELDEKRMKAFADAYASMTDKEKGEFWDEYHEYHREHNFSSGEYVFEVQAYMYAEAMYEAFARTIGDRIDQFLAREGLIDERGFPNLYTVE